MAEVAEERNVIKSKIQLYNDFKKGSRQEFLKNIAYLRMNVVAAYSLLNKF